MPTYDPKLGKHLKLVRRLQLLREINTSRPPITTNGSYV